VSAPTAQILNRAGLGKKFQSEPAEVLAMLHRGLPTASETDRLSLSSPSPMLPGTVRDNTILLLRSMRMLSFSLRMGAPLPTSPTPASASLWTSTIAVPHKPLRPETSQRW
jgi:hypothetical protein